MRDDADGSVVDTHSLLLSLAGLVDDELLGWTRELAAVGEADYALELVTAAIAADRVRLPEPVHAALLAARRGQPGRAEVALPEPEPTPAMPHRFLADPAAVGYPAAVAENFPVETLRTLPGRMLRGCQLWLTWRLTPTGSAPAPVPHPVLLVEAADDGGADLLAYQVADLLWQAGVFASVEVFGADTRLTDYHRAALEAARELDITGGSPATDSAPARRNDPASTPPHGTPAARESTGRSTLRPVDRVITARSASSQRGSVVDNVMPFERAGAERAPDSDGDRRGRFDAFDEGGSDGRQRWSPGREQQVREQQGRDQRGREAGPSRPGAGPGEWQPGPPESLGPPPERRPARGRNGGPGPNGGEPRSGGPGQHRGPVAGGGPGPNGGPGNGVTGTAGTQSVQLGPPLGPPPPMGQPPMTQPPMAQPPVNQQTGRQQQVKPPVNQQTGRQQPVKPAGPQPPPARPPLRQVDPPAEQLPDGLSDVEQRLLRQLHEELAAREDDNGLPAADQPPQRMFRNGGGRGPRRPMGPPPDHAG